MIIVLERGTTEAEQAELLKSLEELGLRGNLLGNLRKPLIHVTQGATLRARKLLGHERVETALPTSGPRIRREGRRFYPYHFINWSSAAILAVALLVVAAGFAPPGVGEEIDPHVAPESLTMPWYLRAPLRFVRAFPRAEMGWLVLAALLAGLFFLPHLDRGHGEGLRGRVPVMLVGLALTAAWVYGTFAGMTP